MEVTVSVTVNITDGFFGDGENITGQAALREAAREAIDNAVRQGADNGFNHALDTTASIEVRAVELS